MRDKLVSMAQRALSRLNERWYLRVRYGKNRAAAHVQGDTWYLDDEPAAERAVEESYRTAELLAEEGHAVWIEAVKEGATNSSDWVSMSSRELPGTVAPARTARSVDEVSGTRGIDALMRTHSEVVDRLSDANSVLTGHLVSLAMRAVRAETLGEAEAVIADAASEVMQARESSATWKYAADTLKGMLTPEVTAGLLGTAAAMAMAWGTKVAAEAELTRATAAATMAATAATEAETALKRAAEVRLRAGIDPVAPAEAPPAA